MLTFKDKHSTNDLLQPKNLRFYSRTNHIQTSCHISGQEIIKNFSVNKK